MKKNSSGIALNKSKNITSNKCSSQVTQSQVDKVTVIKGINSQIQPKTYDQISKKNAPGNCSINDSEPIVVSRSHNNSDGSSLSYNSSFHLPYNFKEVTEPKVRSELMRKKISKLESYLSLCEEFYLGSISKTKSVSEIFQSLIVSHNIDHKEQFNAFLKRQSANNVFAKSNTKANSKNSHLLEPITKAESIISPLHLLTHPFRNKEVIDLWGPHEVILFECGVCKYGKEFDKIQRIIKTKTTKEIIDFYYCVWKRTSRYKAWKNNRQLSEYIFS
ncbi:myb-like DNA-binding domain-containing [Cryptosporidium sp. chipmunk genotype I]|uniref:myb-like DNA-binding domain-containing n=1 Tax=Cryptosporidium sp. chipmunk genotype I TaxID=1280935 RepID=UPI00351A6526|nr:myb-like DNA-binding domain-containing [Cryptosporidium sp. chipmunk genotype I]